MANALGGRRGALALFSHTNKVIDLSKNGEPLYVIIWDERLDHGEIIKSDSSQSDGLRHARLTVEEISRLESIGSPSDEELEKYFWKSKSPASATGTKGDRDDSLVPPARTPEPETTIELENQLQSRVQESKRLTAEARRRRMANASRSPIKIEVRTVAFIRNADVIVETLARASGHCE